jgi:hypothetical protein
VPEEILIREARLEDIAEIVRHRRWMYEDMGERDAPALEAMQAGTSTFLEKALPQACSAAGSPRRSQGAWWRATA